ncbi:hypothetical protein BKA62DRAFT_599015, partial [Auriculariales sp. MPI-PUGE-AT-0066]
LDHTARHVTLTKNGQGRIYCMGMTRSVNHTAATQTDDWVGSFSALTALYDESPLATTRRFNQLHFWQIFSAYMSDHSSDNTLTAQLLQKKRKEALVILMGLEYLDTLSAQDFALATYSDTMAIFEEHGGRHAWEALPAEIQARHQHDVRNKCAIKHGQTVWDLLPDDQKQQYSTMIRAGCGPHKLLNTVVALMKAIRKLYEPSDQQISAPCLLPNATLAAVIGAGDGDGDGVVEDRGSGGAEKFLFLLSHDFKSMNHKHAKGDHYRIFMASRHGGVCPAIPDFQPSRYGSLQDGARYSLRYRNDIIEYLQQHVKQLKSTDTNNNTEKNILSALNDSATLTELVVLARYGTYIGRPYMRHIRANSIVNMVSQGEFHLSIVDKCKFIAQNASDLSTITDKRTLTLDGADPDDTDLDTIICDLALENLVPNLARVTRAAFLGAAGGWTHFSAEFLPGGSLFDVGPDLHHRLVINATNDPSEGYLGQKRISSRVRPNEKQVFFNARTKFGKNGTASWL